VPEPFLEVLYPAGGGALRHAPWERGLLSAVLYPASVVYGRLLLGVRARRTARRRPLDVSAVVISVGNLEVGGNGKTPLAIHLVNELSRRGHRPAYVSRGFKGAAERLGTVSVLVPRSTEPKRWPDSSVRLMRVDAGNMPDALGDEGAVVAMRCSGAPLAFSADRSEAIRVVFEMFEPTHVVVDDAFQSWSVHRDVDIVLLDAEHPIGNGRTLPAGSLREEPAALGRAAVIGFNAMRPADDLGQLGDWVSGVVGRKMPVFGVVRGIALAGGGSGEPVPDSVGPVAALSGIARPSRFEQSLVERGFDVRLSIRYPDHFRYDRHEIRRVDEILARRGIVRLVTTEKDWVKLKEVGPPSVDLLITRLELQITGIDPVRLCERPQAMPAVSS
jgi:tetraacyldisaccharide 4'-kinase